MKTKTIVASVAGGAVLLATVRAVKEYLWWNPAIPKRQADKTLIACVGDSITFGAGVKNPKRDSYPSYLQGVLGDAYQVINYGLSGRTASSGGDLPYMREKLYPRTLTDKPDYVIYMLGTNDSKPYNWDESDFEESCRRMLTRYARVCEPGHVFVMLPPKAFVVAGATEVGYDILDENIVAEQEILRRIAEGLGAQVIDLYSFTEPHAEWLDDGVHPNAVGNKAIAEHVAQAMGLA